MRRIMVLPCELSEQSGRPYALEPQNLFWAGSSRNMVY